MAGELRFGRYILERRLAAGGMAEVFLARLDGPVGFEKRVVVKRILPALTGNSEITRLFLDEARLAALFRHPNLIQVYELFEVVGQYAMAMEYLEGLDVADIATHSAASRSPLPVSFALRLVADAAAGLRHAHELTQDGEPLNIVHRDISPSNIFVTWDGVVKVVDFGIAKSTRAIDMTQEGWFRGKVAYMAPEQTRSEPLDARADIFALGVVLYELLAGRRCYAMSSDDTKLVEAVREGQRTPLRELRSGLPAGVVALVDRMLAVNRDDRVGSALEVRREALSLLAEMGTDESELPRTLSELFGGSEQSEARRATTTAIGVRRREQCDEDPLATVDLPEGELRSAARRAREYDSGWADTVIRNTPTLDRTDIVHYEATPELDATLRDGAHPTVLLSESTITETAPHHGERRPKGTIVALGIVTIAAAAAFALLSTVSSRTPTTLEQVESPHPPSPPSNAAHASAEETVEQEHTDVDEREQGEEREEPDTIVDVSDTSSSEESTTSANAWLSISSEPSMELWLNGRRVGRTPIKRRRVHAGTIKVTLKNKALGLAREMTLRAKPGESVARNVVFGKGKLVVNSHPWAEVYVGKQRLGTTPLPPTELYEGTHRLRLRYPDAGKERTVKVDIRPGQLTKVRESLD